MRMFAGSILVLSLALAACDGPKPVEAPATPAPEAAPAAAPPTLFGPAMGLADDKPALMIAQEALEDGFMKGGYHASALNNTSPSWGSHGLHGDADTGIAKVTFEVPAGAKRIGVPVAMGPTHGLTTLEVLDADDKPIATLAPGPEEYKEWKLWEVTLPVTAPVKLSIEASDTGSEWGQWIAFGQPRVIE